MKEKIQIDECFYLVNGQLGRYNKKTRTFKGVPSKSPQDFIMAYLKDELTEKIFEGGANIVLEPLTKEEKGIFQFEIDRAWLYDDNELLDLLRADKYAGN